MRKTQSGQRNIKILVTQKQQQQQNTTIPSITFLQPSPPSPLLHPLSFPNNHVPKKIKNALTSSSKKATLNIFTSTDIRLEHYKKFPLPFKHHKTSLTTPPTNSSKLSTSTSITINTKSPPNQFKDVNLHHKTSNF